MPSKRRPKNIQTKIIITHKRPDFDAILATWLLYRFGGYDGAAIKFFSFGHRIPQKYDNAVCVDIGGGQFDHHQRSDLVSASMLVLKSLNLHNNPALHHLAEISVFVDHGLFDRIDKRFLGIINLIDAFNNLYPNTNKAIIRGVLKDFKDGESDRLLEKRSEQMLEFVSSPLPKKPEKEEKKGRY